MKIMWSIASSSAALAIALTIGSACALPRPAFVIADAASCQASCKTNADACRAQCSDPEEQQQCIFACGRTECQGTCNRFEEACKQHCPGTS
ncbi:MAG TPA: hypothetical protein VME69_06995 [Methylocella sp.]|nr:hypothetical protein [Methylocella sp.]